MAIETIGAVTASTAGTTLTAHASANTKGAYAELTASTAQDSDGFIVCLARGTLGVDYLVDIATGAAAAESVVVENVPWHAVGNRNMAVFSIPLGIASGTRIAARCQATTGGQTLQVILYAWQLGSVLLGGATTIDTYGATTADSGGVSIDPGGSAHTKGSYTEITASTTAATEQIALATQNGLNLARSNAAWLVDIATGGAGAESVVVNNLWVISSGVALLTPINYPMMPLVIGGSTRIAVRAQCDVTDATDRLFDAMIFAARGADASGGGGGGGAHILGGTVVR